MKYLCLFVLMVAVGNADPPPNCAKNVVLGGIDYAALARCSCNPDTPDVGQQYKAYCPDGGNSGVKSVKACVRYEIATGDGCATQLKRNYKVCTADKWVRSGLPSTCENSLSTTCTSDKTTGINVDCKYTKDGKEKVCDREARKFFYDDDCRDAAACEEGTTKLLTSNCLYSNDYGETCAFNKYFYNSACNDAALQCSDTSSNEVTALTKGCKYSSGTCATGKFYYGSTCNDAAVQCSISEETELATACLYANTKVCAAGKFYCKESSCKDECTRYCDDFTCNSATATKKSAAASIACGEGGCTDVNCCDDPKNEKAAGSTSSAAALGLNTVVFATIVNLL